MDSVDVTDSGDLLVSFKSRSGAEQGMAKGSNIPIIGHVQVSWYTAQSSTTPSTQKASPAPADAGAGEEHAEHAEPRPSSPVHDDMHMHMHEEEMVPGGWGGGNGDDDDEFGML